MIMLVYTVKREVLNQNNIPVEFCFVKDTNAGGIS